MKALRDITCKLNKEQHSLQFRWKVDPGNKDPYIYFAGLKEKGKSLEPDPLFYKEKYLDTVVGSEAKHTCDMDLPEAVPRVTEKKFFAFSSREKMANNTDTVRMISGMLASETEALPYIVSVIIGEANIRYRTDIRPVRGNPGVCAAMISLRSDQEIEESVLGYEYLCGSRTMRFPIPFRIPGGNRKISLPQILIPSSSSLEVVPFVRYENAYIRILYD